MELSLDVLKTAEGLAPFQVRELILKIEERIKEHPASLNGRKLRKAVPVAHRFADGMYVRECKIPAGLVVVGMIHRHEHPVFLLKGKAKIITESGGVETITAPFYGISPAHTKRFVYAIEDTVWVTTHVNPDNCRDIEELERRLVAEHYEDIKEAV